MVAADLSKETVNNSMEALRAGALSVVEKPTIDSAEAYAAMARGLCSQFVNLSAVKVVRQRFNAAAGAGRRARRGGAAAAAPAGAAAGSIDVVGIVASTGGPPAVANVLQGLGAAFPAPVLVVQHMGAGFLEGYASWLNSVCDIDVVLAKDGVEPVAGPRLCRARPLSPHLPRRSAAPGRRLDGARPRAFRRRAVPFAGRKRRRRVGSACC